MRRRIITEFQETKIDSKIREKGLQMNFYGVTLLDNSQPIHAHIQGDFPLRILDSAMQSFELDSKKIPLLSQHTDGDNPYDFDAKSVIGYIENIRYKNKKIIGDIFLLPDSPIAQHIASLIASKVMHGISVEMSTDFDFDSRNREYVVKHFKIISAALVSNPACKKCFI